MQLSELITTDKLNVLNSCAKCNERVKRAYTHTPHWVRNFILFEIAPNTKRGVSAFFWDEVENAYHNSDNIVIIVSKGRACVREIQYNKTHAYHIMRELEAGKQVYLITTSEVRLLSSEDAWNILTNRPTAHNYEYAERNVLAERHIKEERRREKAFCEAAKANRYRKAGKRGFNTQFNETHAYERCSAYQLRISTL